MFNTRWNRSFVSLGVISYMHPSCWRGHIAIRPYGLHSEPFSYHSEKRRISSFSLSTCSAKNLIITVWHSQEKRQDHMSPAFFHFLCLPDGKFSDPPSHVKALMLPAEGWSAPCLIQILSLLSVRDCLHGQYNPEQESCLGYQERSRLSHPPPDIIPPYQNLKIIRLIAVFLRTLFVLKDATVPEYTA